MLQGDLPPTFSRWRDCKGARRCLSCRQYRETLRALGQTTPQHTKGAHTQPRPSIVSRPRCTHRPSVTSKAEPLCSSHWTTHSMLNAVREQRRERMRLRGAVLMQCVGLEGAYRRPRAEALKTGGLSLKPRGRPNAATHFDRKNEHCTEMAH